MIRRDFKQDSYTVASAHSIWDLGNFENPFVRYEVVYDRGVGIINADSILGQAIQQNTSGEGLLTNIRVYTKQGYPVVEDVKAGHPSDYVLYEDIDGTPRWYAASSWRDWGNKGINKYQEVLCSYIADDPDLAQFEERPPLNFKEIDDYNFAVDSLKRIVDLKMLDLVLPNYPIIKPNIPFTEERYIYRLTGTDYFLYNYQNYVGASQAFLSENRQLVFNEGNSISFTFSRDLSPSAATEILEGTLTSPDLDVPELFLTLNTDGSLTSSSPTLISKVLFDGVEVTLGDVIYPSNTDLHTVQVFVSQTCYVDSFFRNHKGFITNMTVKRGSRETVYDLGTVGSRFQSARDTSLKPLTSFLLTPIYDNWEIIEV